MKNRFICKILAPVLAVSIPFLSCYNVNAMPLEDQGIYDGLVNEGTDPAPLFTEGGSESLLSTGGSYSEVDALIDSMMDPNAAYLWENALELPEDTVKTASDPLEELENYEEEAYDAGLPKTIKLSKTKFTYNGKVQKPTVTVKDSNGKTVSKSSYDITYSSGCKEIGKYKVRIKFKGSYSGTKDLSFQIAPASIELKSVKKGTGNTATVTYTKNTNKTTGYIIQCSTSSNFAKPSSKLIKSNKTVSVNLKGYKSGKKYYVRVAAYTNTSSGKIYSEPSNVLTVSFPAGDTAAQKNFKFVANRVKLDGKAINTYTPEAMARLMDSVKTSSITGFYNTENANGMAFLTADKKIFANDFSTADLKNIVYNNINSKNARDAIQISENDKYIRYAVFSYPNKKGYGDRIDDTFYGWQSEGIVPYSSFLGESVKDSLEGLVPGLYDKLSNGKVYDAGSYKVQKVVSADGKAEAVILNLSSKYVVNIGKDSNKSVAYLYRYKK